MQTDVIFTTPDATIGEVAQLMLFNAIGSLPVVDEKHHVIGIITESDIFRMVVRDWNRQEASGE
jgi:acetoin utilization protein AcuB